MSRRNLIRFENRDITLEMLRSNKLVQRESDLRQYQMMRVTFGDGKLYEGTLKE